MFRDKLKHLMGKEEEGQVGTNKKKVENLVFFIILLIITVVVINVIWNGNKQTNKQETNNSTSKQLANTSDKTAIPASTTAENLEEKLKAILSNIQGVGEVNVLIHYSESSQTVPMYNENSKTNNTEETDTSGGSRKIEETDTQKDVIFQEDNGQKTPITQKTIQPKVEGAIITAKGANNAMTKTNIVQAVEAVTGLATHKIQVFEMN